MSKRFFWIFGLLVFLFAHAPAAWATYPSCEYLHNTKQYLKSFRCFTAKANRMKLGNLLGAIDRSQKEDLLLNAIQGLKMLALQKNTKYAALIREHAVKLFDRIFRENLCEPRRCEKHRLERKKLHQQIGYGRLSIVTDLQRSAKIKIEGYRYVQTHTVPPLWSQLVRPGLYIVEVHYAGQGFLRRQIRVSPSKSSRVVFTVPPLALSLPPNTLQTEQSSPLRPTVPTVPSSLLQSPRARAMPWLVVGIGALVLATGVITAGMGHARDSQLSSYAAGIRSEAANKTETQLDIMLREDRSAVAVKNMHQSSQTAIVVGWIALGTGVAVALGGTLWLILGKKSGGPRSGAPLVRPVEQLISNATL